MRITEDSNSGCGLSTVMNNGGVPCCNTRAAEGSSNEVHGWRSRWRKPCRSLAGLDCNKHGTIYAISSDFGDRMTMQSMGLMLLLSLGVSPASQRPSGLVWSGVDKLCAGNVEIPFLGGEAP